VLDTGEVLIESGSILDHIDSLVPPEQAMFPRAEPARRQALKAAALATGLNRFRLRLNRLSPRGA